MTLEDLIRRFRVLAAARESTKVFIDQFGTL